MWNELTFLAADPGVTVLAAGDGWGGVMGIIDNVKDNSFEIGLAFLGIVGIVVGIKVGLAGKGKARESMESIAFWAIGGLIVGLALFIPGVMSKLGQDVGSGTGGGNQGVSVVDGQ
ncbi:hypothetical protein [Prescottella agglutinans]|uniref:Uncharacterized protein n=1 Tax=Prescottella agglutinans TaxID=1644129 RepID=A0ABT6MJV2_9NOCA|nr:hypothetical protein [Prescottella agglutinans]MDH6284588.1 hypothetical protein [Prescottella agglutinans]